MGGPMGQGFFPGGRGGHYQQQQGPYMVCRLANTQIEDKKIGYQDL